MRNSIDMFGFRNKSTCLVFAVFLLSLGYIYGQGQIYTVPTIYSNKATLISGKSPMTPSGGNGIYLSIGKFAMALFPSGTHYYNERSLVEFDLTSIPSNAIVMTASLKLDHYSGTSTPPIVTARAASSWIESSVSWDNQPAYQTIDEITTTPPASGIFTINVKDHVQKMVAEVYPNNGWVLRGNASVESNLIANNRIYYSDDYSVTTSRPRLDISYYIPMSVSTATIVHANTNSPTETTGSISPVLTNGPGGTYTYQWYNASGAMSGKTSLNLTGVPYGWYGLKVTSSVAGTEPFFYAFLVGVNCQEVSIEFNPGSDYIDDANLEKSFMIGSQNEVTNYHNSINLTMYTGGFSYTRSVLKYRLWLDQLMHVVDAVMSLNANNVNYSSSNPNSGAMYVITEDWNEKVITHSNQPGYSVTNSIPVSSLSNAPQIRQFDVADQFNSWKQDNTQNFGWLMKLDNESGFVEISQRYNSSDATSNRPKINFLISVSNPTAPNYCNQVFAKMDRTLRGVLYKPYLAHLYFYYDEEYATSDAGLNYKVYKADAPLVPVLNHTIQPLTEIEYGDNRYTLDVSDLQAGVYVLEITNNKSEKFYLRFKVED